MKKIVVVWAYILLVGEPLLFAQIQNSKDFSSQSVSSSWIAKSVRQSLFIVNSSYKVQDGSGQLFDREGRTDFNNCSLLGVQIEKTLVTPGEAISPWINDTAFSAYKESYSPVLHMVEKRNLDQKDYIIVEFDSSVCKQNDGICLFPNEESGLSYQNKDASEVSGHIVWVVSPDSPGKCDSVHLIINTYTRTNNNIVDGPKVSKIDEILSLGKFKQIIGGIFVVPSFPEPGVVRFNVAALLKRSHREMGKWEVVVVSDGYKDVTEDDGLVPSKNTRNQKPSARKRKK